jgi:hypothetical protein
MPPADGPQVSVIKAEAGDQDRWRMDTEILRGAHFVDLGSPILNSDWDFYRGDLVV